MSPVVLVISSDPAVRAQLVPELAGRFAVRLLDTQADGDWAVTAGGRVVGLVVDHDASGGHHNLALLERIATLWPRAARVLLSSSLHAHEVDRQLRHGLIHAFVRKPIRPGALAIALESA